MRALAVSALLVLGACKRQPPQQHDKPPETAETAQMAGAARPDAAPRPRIEAPHVEKPDPEKDEYIADVVAFTGETRERVRERMKLGAGPLAEEWKAWEAKGPMTEARIRAFYKQTTNYIYELGEWHLSDPIKRVSDVRLVEDLKRVKPKNVLDFGGGTGNIAILLARAGLDVTLADLDSKTLEFAAFRAKRHGDKLKIWKTDVEPMPPDKKYDVILALDVLEHLPKQELQSAVDKLVKLKHNDTLVIMSAPFGRTAAHPMHLDADEHTKAQVKRLTEAHGK